MIIVVVGHGRSPEGQGWGKLIDSADIVVRMWEWHWQAPVDYGTRYDWGLIETHRKVLDKFDAFNSGKPRLGWIASKLYCNARCLATLPPNSIVVDQEQWLKQEGAAIKGFGETGKWQLTRGGVAACFAISRAKPGTTLVLVGFDNIRRGVALAPDAAFSPIYQADPAFWGMDGYKEGATKEGNHDYPAERRLIELVASRRGGVTVAFAQDFWPCSSISSAADLPQVISTPAV